MQKIAVVGAEKLTIKETVLIAEAAGWCITRNIKIVTTNRPGADAIVLLVCNKNKSKPIIITKKSNFAAAVAKAAQAVIIIGNDYKVDALIKRFEAVGKKVKHIFDVQTNL